MSGAAIKLNVRPAPTKKTVKLNVRPSVKLNVQKKKQPTPKSNSEEYRVTAESYSSYELREHIYNVTDSYCGNDQQIEREEYVLDFESRKMEMKTITLPQVMENIFLEIVSNAGDNVARSVKNNRDPGRIEITMTDTKITVRNGGAPIPIEINEKENTWAPEMIFGKLLTSSNYDTSKARIETGRNGYGAKLTNIFSKHFEITVGDPYNQKHYTQVWRNNMTEKEEPVITDFSHNKEAFVEVCYEMDFKRFGYTKYPEEAISLFARHVADLSYAQKVPVVFNGEVFNIKRAKEYAKLFLPVESIKSSVVYFQWRPGTETITKKGVEIATDKSAVPLIELCAVDTPDNAINISFVNGKWTRNGGVHADAAFNAFSKDIVDMINNTGKSKGKKKSRSMKISKTDVKRHVSLFLNCWVEDPKFDNQYKTALLSPAPKISITEEVLKPIMKWELLARLYAELDAKHFRAASKSDGKKRRNLSGIEKLEDANHAGDAQSMDCALWITEGDSASNFAVEALKFIPGGRDYVGIFPLKGKPLNVMNAPLPQIANNTEISSLKKVLGLREGVNYLDDENFKTLRYGHLMILADSDDDGKHILGLVLNLFHCKFPTLLARNYVMYLRTKILDIRKGRKHRKFYTQHDYELWKEKNPDWRTWQTKYFKGLGTSLPADIKEEFKSPKIVNSIYDNLAPYKLQLAFDNRFANNRKEWISSWIPDYSVEKMMVQPISSFVDHELIQYSITDLCRSIPRFLDGLKISQRKILWAAIMKWKSKIGNKDVKETKVANFASYVSAECSYKHGEKSLEGAIVNMAQDFVGTNNMPYLYRGGLFGCLDPQTPVLLWNGEKALAEDIKVGDELIGDDGLKRTVQSVVSSVDTMYEVKQIWAKPYVVNSIHILTLVVPYHKRIFWKKSEKTWYMFYLDRENKRVKKKSIRTKDCKTKRESHSDKSTLSKEEAYDKIQNFRNTLPDDNIIDIPLNEFIKLSKSQQKFFYGFTLFNPIQWKKQDVPIDPYILGAWLGDGDSHGGGFTTIDDEMVKRYCIWADTIGAEVVHNKKEYHFSIRRKGAGMSYGDRDGVRPYGKLLAIGDPKHNIENCVGCKSSKTICTICDWTFEDFKDENVEVIRKMKNGRVRKDLNPFKEVLKSNNLHMNKHIPE